MSDTQLRIGITATDTASAQIKLLQAQVKSFSAAIAQDMTANAGATTNFSKQLSAQVTIMQAQIDALKAKSAAVTSGAAVETAAINSTTAATDAGAISWRRYISLGDEFARGQRGQMFATLGAAVKDANGNISGLIGPLTGLAAIMAGVFTAHEVQSATQWAQGVQAASAATGMSIGQFIQLTMALDALGVKGEQGDRALRDFAKSLNEAATDPMSKAAKAFQNLNIFQNDAKNSLNDVYGAFLRVSAILQQYPESALKAATINGIFAQSAQKIGEAFAQGGESVQKAADATKDQADKATEAIPNLIRLGDEIDTLKENFSRGADIVISSFVPALEAAGTLARELIAPFTALGQVIGTVAGDFIGATEAIVQYNNTKVGPKYIGGKPLNLGSGGGQGQGQSQGSPQSPMGFPMQDNSSALKPDFSMVPNIGKMMAEQARDFGRGWEEGLDAVIHRMEEAKRAQDKLTEADEHWAAASKEIFDSVLRVDEDYVNRRISINDEIVQADKKYLSTLVKDYSQAFNEIASQSQQFSESLLKAIISPGRSTTTQINALGMRIPVTISAQTQEINAALAQLASSFGDDLLKAMEEAASKAIAAHVLSPLLGVSSMTAQGEQGGISTVLSNLFSAQTTATAVNTVATVANTSAVTGASAATATSSGGGILGGLTKLASIFGFSGGGVVPSAEGGMVVGGMGNAGGGILSILHPNEMVLPAYLSQGFQRLLSQGNVGGTGININISAIDGQSVANLFKNNSNTITNVIAQAVRGGNTSLNNSLGVTAGGFNT